MDAKSAVRKTQGSPKSRWALLDGGGVALQFPTGTAAAPDDSALLVLGTRDDDDAARLRAGEALSHLTLTATAMGLASCPLTEPLDDIRSSLALACEVFDGEAHPQALIRVGLAPSGDDPLPTTQRRSVNEVTVWAESR